MTNSMPAEHTVGATKLPPQDPLDDRVSANSFDRGDLHASPRSNTIGHSGSGERFELTAAALQAWVEELAQDGSVPPYIPAFRSTEGPVSLGDTLREELAGKTVLDVGCNLGLRCFEALRQGATRVVGIDANPERVLQARALATAMGVEAEFVHMDADWSLPEGCFDVVLCFDVLHRSVDPAGLLQRLGARVGDTLVLEERELDHPTAEQFFRDIGLSRWHRRALREAPVLLVGRNGPQFHVPEARFFLTREAIRQLLLRHQRRFATVEITARRCRAAFQVVARRWKIRHLVVVAGASGVGKSTFIERLRTGTLPRDLIEELGLSDVRSAAVVDAFDDVARRMPYTDTLVFHYDLNRFFRFPSKRTDRDDSLQLIHNAERVSCITLWVDHETLRRRKHQRSWVAEAKSRGGVPFRARLTGWLAAVRNSSSDGSRRSLETSETPIAANSALVDSMYSAWFRFCAELPAVELSMVVAGDGGYTVLQSAHQEEFCDGAS